MGTTFDDGGDEREGERGSIHADAERRLQAVLAEQDDAPVEIEASPLALPVGLHLDVPEASYHADCSEGISLSSSMASIVLRNARLAYRYHPKLGGQGSRHATKAMDGGALVHMLLLGSGPEVAVVDAADWRTKKAKQDKADARAAGKLPILAKDYHSATEIATTAHKALVERGIDLSAGHGEATIIWKEGETLCRGRLDNWSPEIATVYDVKYLASAEPEAFGRHVLNFGCDVQAAAYTSGISTLYPELAGRVKFVNVVIEQGTGEILIARPGGTMRSRGAHIWHKALGRWGECLASGKWPGYNDDQVYDVDLPEWSMRDVLEGGSPGISF